MKQNVIKYLAVAAGVGLITGATAYANSIPITDGGGNTSLAGDTTTVSAGATELATETKTLVQVGVNPAPAGTITSSVYSGDANNPNGGLTFVYQITLAANSPTFAEIYSSPTAWSSSLLLNAGFDHTPPGVINPNSINWAGLPNGVLTWTFNNTIGAGQESAELIIESSAKSYVNPTWQAQDGGQSQAPAFAPSLPDGGLTMMLLGGTSLGLAALRRKLS
jgi:hypothetical protein